MFRRILYLILLPIIIPLALFVTYHTFFIALRRLTLTSIVSTLDVACFLNATPWFTFAAYRASHALPPLLWHFSCKTVAFPMTVRSTSCAQNENAQNQILDLKGRWENGRVLGGGNRCGSVNQVVYDRTFPSPRVVYVGYYWFCGFAGCTLTL